MNNSTAPSAIRTTTTSRSGKVSARITVTYPDGRSIALGGARALRAQAVIIGHHERSENKWKELGCRADLAAATQEAHRLATATTMRHAGHTFDITPYTDAIAVPVTEAAQ